MKLYWCRCKITFYPKYLLGAATNKEPVLFRIIEKAIFKSCSQIEIDIPCELSITKIISRDIFTNTIINFEMDINTSLIILQFGTDILIIRGGYLITVPLFRRFPLFVFTTNISTNQWRFNSCLWSFLAIILRAATAGAWNVTTAHKCK